jgi:hypothetical protein
LAAGAAQRVGRLVGAQPVSEVGGRVGVVGDCDERVDRVEGGLDQAEADAGRFVVGIAERVPGEVDDGREEGAVWVPADLEGVALAAGLGREGVQAHSRFLPTG